MTDIFSKPDFSTADDDIDLTQTIRRLSVPTSQNDDLFEEEEGTAMLLCRDSASQKWGPRWLNRVGLQAKIVADPINVLSVAREERPDIVIAEAGMTDRDGTPLYQRLLDAADLEMPIIVLCSSSRELSNAVEAEPHDIVRKPFEWQMISRRARNAARLRWMMRKIEDGNESLGKALALADSARQQLRSRESFEPVTGLPNKTKFIDLLKRAMSAVDRDNNVLAVIVVGFNRFRLVIEAMGQERADMILTEIGNGLTACLRETGPAPPEATGLRTAAVASIDHSRFALMLTTSTETDELTSLREAILDKLARPIQFSAQTIYLSACLGVALYPQDADDVDSLLQRADNAMRDAQSRGGGFRYYCAETDAAAARKLKLEHMLHEALDRRELSLAWQPITEVSSGLLLAAEALLRWRQPDGSWIAPGEFVPVAEESGLMIRIGEFVLAESVKQLREWRDAGMALPQICVNVSKVQLMSGGFVAAVKRVLTEYEIAPGDLELELSERGVLSGDYSVISQLDELKALGVRLSVDDFGTGDSAIAYLRDLPLDVLKVDQSYIAGITDKEKDADLVSAMVALGQRLGLIVVAEGVETREQLAALQNLGCDAFQGHLVSEPVPGAEFAALLRSPSQK